MLMETPAESGVTEEPVVTDTTADLSTENTNGPIGAEQEVPANQLDETEGMDDAAFTEFMNSQLAGVSENEEEASQIEEDEATQDDASPEDESTPDGEDSDSGDSETTAGVLKFNIAGQDIEVSDPADISRLVERGLNAAIEAKDSLPAHKLQQMLAKNNLADVAKLNHLIDIANGDKDAMRQLLKDQDIDPYDLASPEGEEAAPEYKPKDHAISDDAVKRTRELNSVLDSLQDTESFATTADIVMEQWDESSREIFMANPKNFTVLNNQVTDGTFDAITSEIKKLDIMGKLPKGENQFDVYRLVGDNLFEQKRLPGQTAKESTKEIPAKDEDALSPEQRLSQAADTKRRKRAVAPSRSIPKSQTHQQSVVDSDAFSSSDEEFIRKTSHLFNTM